MGFFVLSRWLSFQGGIAVHIVDKPWKGCCVGSLVSGRSAESSPFSSASFIQRRAPPLTIAFIPSSIPINKMLMPKRRSTASPRPIPKEISSSSSDSNLSPFSSPKDQSAQKEPRNSLSLQGTWIQSGSAQVGLKSRPGADLISTGSAVQNRTNAQCLINT